MFALNEVLLIGVASNDRKVGTCMGSKNRVFSGSMVLLDYQTEGTPIHVNCFMSFKFESFANKIGTGSKILIAGTLAPMDVLACRSSRYKVNVNKIYLISSCPVGSSIQKIKIKTTS